MAELEREQRFKKRWQAFLAADQNTASGAGDAHIRLVNSLLRAAVRAGASDIHLEPWRLGSYRVRLRIDGVLGAYMALNQDQYEGIVGRLRILGQMDIAENRSPADGSFAREIDGRIVSFRLAQMPTVWGLKLVIRILDDRRFGQSLEALGMDAVNCAGLRRLLAGRSGLILAAGPTGSGKTTTLYSLVAELDTEHLNIVTIEDPVEYRIPGISQMEVAGGKVDFAGGLRALLRQDPDVILLGEIRDEVTAVTAVRAAVTGHLVLSTLHAEGAVSAVLRLKNMGVPPYLLAAGLKGVLAQRLLGRLCPYCRTEMADDGSSFSKLTAGKRGRLWQASGCTRCRGRGILGRQAFFELMTVQGELRRALLSETEDLRTIAAAQGMTSMAEAVRRAVSAGQVAAGEGMMVMERAF